MVVVVVVDWLARVCVRMHRSWEVVEEMGVWGGLGVWLWTHQTD